MENIVEKYYDLNDPLKTGPRGFLFAYDENGKLLFTSENMIVKTGRSALMQYGFDNVAGSKITHVLIGDDANVTTPDNNLANYPEKKIKTINGNNKEYFSFNGSCIGENTRLISKRLVDMLPTNLPDTITGAEAMSISTPNIKDSSNNPIIRGSIIGRDGENNVITILPASHGVGTDIVGSDESCFDIWKDATGSVKALVKIFVRKTYSDEGDDGEHPKDKISCLALCMGDPKTANGSTLFSRVVFPPYYKSSSQAIIFNYYIYF